ncbi:hypothetical protein GWK47_023703 [Chionoecetes opilio]|uniref:Reverse transcriptase domain-containing protein n=1 Tax=Chionoecetes opilio TaxID=41210 RepID=A0A8J4XM90_CHIOP|nr:hypothetical protein GWK47_023703 [Chionoecetes opilio]
MPPDDDGRQPAAVDMDTSSSVPKRSRSPSPPSGETRLPDKTCKLARSFASITASSPPRDAIPTTSAASESACPLLSQPTRLIIIRGIKFEVAKLDNLAQPPESVTTLGEWSVKCWVASDDDPTYMFGRIFPVSPEMTTDEILAGLTVLDGSPSVILSALRLPTPVRDGESEANMAIRVKFRGPLPDRVSLDNAVYWVRPHTLPVLRCTRCFLFGHGNATCNMKIRCSNCSGFHVAEGCARPVYCLFCGDDHRPTYKQCPAYLQAVQVQLLQHDATCSISDVKRKLRGIHPGTFRPRGPPVREPSSPTRHLPCPPVPGPPPACQPNPRPAPCHPMSPSITVVQLAAGCVTPTRPPTISGSPSSKPQRHQQSPRHRNIPQLKYRHRPSFLPEGPYREDMGVTFLPPTPLSPNPPPRPVPSPPSQPQRHAQLPAAQQPLPSLGSASLAPPSPSQAQHASGFAWSFSLVIGNTHSRSYPVTRDVPQGSPLSPVLFNILLSDFPCSPCTHALIYADDISLICSAPTIQEAQDHLQRGLMPSTHGPRWGLTWVPSHIGVRGNTVADRAAAEAHSLPSPIDTTTDLTDLLTNLQTTCNRHWDTELTNALQYTSLGRIRQDTRHHWWTHSPSRAL